MTAEHEEFMYGNMIYRFAAEQGGELEEVLPVVVCGMLMMVTTMSDV